ncbi:molybdopterin-dependent oxidoreductase [Nocardia concava]|uniref:molybdopterin-dependent oxidoreductase n=1 Tax=Nocardia concava TaxID=257281 RepID=UPI00030ADB35|nr:molybdopterin-dependent oxidoreductase [Nocardia concava]
MKPDEHTDAADATPDRPTPESTTEAPARRPEVDPPGHPGGEASGHPGMLLAGIHTAAVDSGQKHAGMTGESPGRAGTDLLLPPVLADRLSPARSTAVAARVGIALGVGIAILFVTGLISHFIQHPPDWFWWPAHPVWLYRVTQGTHVTVGVMMIPLLLVKLWSVYPRFFLKPSVRRALPELLERASVAVLIGAVLFQIVTGLFNTAQFYPWKFFFTTTHHAMAYVAFGAVVVHLAVKLPVVRQALSRPVSEEPESEGQVRSGVSRRALLVAAGLGTVVAGLAVAGQSVPFLRRVSVLAPRSGEGPQGVPINRTAAAAAVTETARSPQYALAVKVAGRQRGFSRAELEALPQYESVLPIACVEGWSATGHWSGVRLRDLLAQVGGYSGGDLRFDSLETTGIYGSSRLPRDFVTDDSTLIALRLNGEELTLDHGYPCRLIAPNRPGVLQTKWLKSIEELS